MNEILPPALRAAFGDPTTPMREVERRAREAYPDRRMIVWEGNAQTFAFGYVGGDAEALLGHPASSWTATPDFWTRAVVHPEDESDAVAYCALATAKKSDHVFRYRARTTGGDIVWLEDFVQVVLGPRGLPSRLRGLMLEVDGPGEARRRYVPSLEELQAAP